MPTDVNDAKSRLAAQLIELPGVTAIGVSESGGEPCLRVWVVEHTEELRGAIPREFDGFAVLVQRSGPIEALEQED